MRRVVAWLAVLGVMTPLLVLGLPPAQAVPPDRIPVPACVAVDDPSCLPDGNGTTMTTAGDVIEGVGVAAAIVPGVPACTENAGPVAGGWSNAPCYSAITFPSGPLTCLVAEGESARRLPCSDALYLDGRSPAWARSSTQTRPQGSGLTLSSCGSTSDFATYIYGGPANVPSGKWSEYGPTGLECDYMLTSGRPDGLYGPTWVLLSGSILVHDNSEPVWSGGSNQTGAAWVWVNGDLRPGTLDVQLVGVPDEVDVGEEFDAELVLTVADGGTAVTNLTTTIELSEGVEYRNGPPMIPTTIASGGTERIPLQLRATQPGQLSVTARAQGNAGGSNVADTNARVFHGRSPLVLEVVIQPAQVAYNPDDPPSGRFTVILEVTATGTNVVEDVFLVAGGPTSPPLTITSADVLGFPPISIVESPPDFLFGDVTPGDPPRTLEFVLQFEPGDEEVPYPFRAEVEALASSGSMPSTSRR